MANELEITGIAKYNKNGIKSELSLSSRVNITGSKTVELIQTVGVSEEALLLGDIAGLSAGYVLIENLDDTNYVSIRPAAGEPDLIKIQAGKFAGPFELAASAPYIVADTDTCNVRVLLIEK